MPATEYIVIIPIDWTALPMTTKSDVIGPPIAVAIMEKKNIANKDGTIICNNQSDGLTVVNVSCMDMMNVDLITLTLLYKVNISPASRFRVYFVLSL
jgi:hypothetical protein